MEELEEVLGINSYPMNWPIGMGKEFLGIYDRYNNRIEQFRTEEEDRYLPLDEDGQLSSRSRHERNFLLYTSNGRYYAIK